MRAVNWGVGILLMTTILASASGPGPDFSSQIDALFASIDLKTPGAAVLVIKDGQAAFQRGYGVTDLRAFHRIDEHTNFRLASVTKQFTAMAIMLLVHDGKLRYEEKLTEVFPEFPAYGKTISIRNLLNHTSGLPDYEDLMTRQYGNTPDDQIPQIHDAGVLALLEKERAPKFPAGSKWAYSNSGYCTLAMVVEKISGQSFADFLRDRIFEPLQMANTLAYERGKNEVVNRAYGYTKESDGWHQTDQSATSATLGDGGVYTSLVDMTRWDAALREHTLLSERQIQPALVAVQPTSAPAEENGHSVSYGFGWFLDPYKSYARMWHYGETVGFRTSIQRFPKDNLTVVVLCNRTDLQAPDLALKVADLFLTAGH